MFNILMSLCVAVIAVSCADIRSGWDWDIQDLSRILELLGIRSLSWKPVCCHCQSAVYWQVDWTPTSSDSLQSNTLQGKIVELWFSCPVIGSVFSNKHCQFGFCFNWHSFPVLLARSPKNFWELMQHVLQAWCLPVMLPLLSRHWLEIIILLLILLEISGNFTHADHYWCDYFVRSSFELFFGMCCWQCRKFLYLVI